MLTNNEKSYYDRMNSTMSDKCKTLKPYLFNGVKVLDFGAGKDIEIAKLVKSYNGSYIAVDRSSQVQEYFENNNIICYGDIKDINENVDIIFLSSVYHELLSYLNPLEISSIISSFSKILKPDGKIVIRDWNTLDIDKWHTIDEMKIKKEKYEEILKWIKVLKENCIIENSSLIEVNDTSIKGYRNDLYNIMYHATWGLASIPRESKENYAITLDSIYRYFYNNNLVIDEKEIKWDDTYINYMNEYFLDYEKKINDRETWMAPKVRIILKYKKTLDRI